MFTVLGSTYLPNHSQRDRFAFGDLPFNNLPSSALVPRQQTAKINAYDRVKVREQILRTDCHHRPPVSSCAGYRAVRDLQLIHTAWRQRPVHASRTQRAGHMLSLFIAAPPALPGLEQVNGELPQPWHRVCGHMVHSGWRTARVVCRATCSVVSGPTPVLRWKGLGCAGAPSCAQHNAGRIRAHPRVSYRRSGPLESSRGGPSCPPPAPPSPEPGPPGVSRGAVTSEVTVYLKGRRLGGPGLAEPERG